MDVEEAWRRKYRIDLETPRLLLRPLILEDADWLTSLFADPEVGRFLWDGASAPEQARRTAESVIYLDLKRCWFGHWAIQDKATGIIHGWTELSKLRPWSGPSDEIALSYVLCRTSWRRGIATEAAGRLLQHAFEIQRLNRVMAVIMAGNTASKRVLQKLGMRLIEGAERREGMNLQYFKSRRLVEPRRADRKTNDQNWRVRDCIKVDRSTAASQPSRLP